MLADYSSLVELLSTEALAEEERTALVELRMGLLSIHGRLELRQECA
jgi:hypothetical protein